MHAGPTLLAASLGPTDDCEIKEPRITLGKVLSDLFLLSNSRDSFKWTQPRV